MKKTKNSQVKTPTQGRSENLVQSILTAATRILEKSGFDQSTTNRIAEVAGVSIGSFYQYFPNKGALVAALIDRQIEKNLSKMEETIHSAPHENLAQAIPYLVDAVVELLWQEKGFFSKLFVEALRLNRVELLVKARESGAQLFESILNQHRDELESQDTAKLAFVCTNAVMGVIQISVLSVSPVLDKEALKEELVKLVCGYLVIR